MNPNKALWEKGDFTRIAANMRESGEALVAGLGITKGLKVLDLGCGTGHPSYVMSSSFANQVLAQIELWSNHSNYAIGVHILPKQLDEKVARLQLAKLNAELTVLTDQQARYIDVGVGGPYKSEHYRY